MSNGNLFRYVAMIAIMVVLAELTAYGMIWLSRPLFSEPIRTTADIYREQSERIRERLAMDGRGRDIVDAQLGWRYRSGFSNRGNHINLQGLRSDREYAFAPPAGVVRVAAFGDSFVYGNEVDNDDAWAHIAESTFERLEVLNYGVGGYGLDQALLRYRAEGNQLSPHIVLIGFIADDIRRVVSVYRRFASTRSGIFTKPRFLFEADGDMDLIPSPIRDLDDWRAVLDDPGSVRAWGAHDQWYEPLVYQNPLYDVSALVRLLSTVWIRLDNRYFDPDRLFLGDRFNPHARGYLLQMAIFERFVEDVRRSGAHPIILILPSRGELSSAFQGRETPYDFMLTQLSARGIEHWNATDAFLPLKEHHDLNAWFAPGGHYSPLGNRIVATWLGPELLELGAQVVDR